LALAYVDIHAGVVGTSLVIKTERQDLTGKIVDLPFYKKATGRADIRIFI